MVRHRCALSGYRLGALLSGKSAAHALVSISSCGLVSVFLRPGKGLIAEGKRGDLESRSVDFRVPFLLGRSCGWPAMHHEPCCQLALRTPSSSHSAGSPTPAYQSAGLWRGRDGRGWPSARPPRRGNRAMPRDSRSRFSPALRGWPVAASRWPRHWLPGGLRTLHSLLSPAGLAQIPTRGRG